MITSEFKPVVGVPLQVAEQLQVVLAPNPSPMTYWGTNTYILGDKDVAVIDPGPDDPAHLAAILSTMGTRRLRHIILTHSHLDHSSLARPLASATGAKVLAFGDSHAGRSPVMHTLATAGYAGGGEGMDWDFAPDALLADGDVVAGGDWELTALHTPGHIGNHLCLRWGDAIFTGDHVMGWSTSLVSPPDGDMTDFLDSCARLHAVPSRVYYPGHGAPVLDTAQRLADLIAHRAQRTAQIIACLAGADPAGMTVAALTSAIYADAAPALFPAASRNVFAHLIDLQTQGKVWATPTLAHDATFHLI